MLIEAIDQAVRPLSEGQPVAMAMEAIEALEADGIECARNVELNRFSYLRTGGRARFVVFPSSRQELATTMQVLTHASVPFKVIGNTSNLIFLDDSEYCCLVSMIRLNRMEFDDQRGEVVAEAGVMIPDLARFALSHCRTGMEGLEGIPGTLGGAIFMNAGAYGSEIRDCLVEIETIDGLGAFKKYSLAESGLTHRSSIFRKKSQGAVVYACRFVLAPADERVIFSRMELFHAKRHRYQDFMYPNLGSIFSGSPYRALARKDPFFGLAARLHFLLGYKLKVLGRESPINRRWLNDLAVKRFGWSYERQPFSDKTINCLVNRGQGTSEMVRYIRELQLLSPGVPLENEIVEPF